MMPAMDRRPENHGALGRHGTKNDHRNFERSGGLEGAMRHQAMKSHSNPEHCHYIHSAENSQVRPIDTTTPEYGYGPRQPGIREQHRQHHNPALLAPGTFANRTTPSTRISA